MYDIKTRQDKTRQDKTRQGEIVVSDRDTKVIYYNNRYIKYFYPNIIKKLKYFFRISRYPGYNFVFIDNILRKLKLNVPKILRFNKYMVETEEISGINLYDKLENLDKNEKKYLLDEYIQIVSKILKNNIYFGDFSFDNFIYNEKDKKIYIIDLEDYRKNIVSRFRKKEAIERLGKKLNHLEMLSSENSIYTAKEIIGKIKKGMK